MALISSAGNVSDEELGDNETSQTIIPAQLDNESGDLMILFCNTSKPSSPYPSITAPGGSWTELYNARQNDLISAVFYRISSQTNEQFPDVAIADYAGEWSTISVVITDVTGSPIGNTAVNISNAGPDLPVGADSVVLYLYAEEDNLITSTTLRSPNQVIEQTQTQAATAEGVSNHCRFVSEYCASAQTTDGPTIGSNGDKRHHAIEVRTNGNLRPILATSFPSDTLTFNSTGTDRTWIDAMRTSGKDLWGRTIPVLTFDASANVDTGTDLITITGHGIVTSSVVHVTSGATNTLPTGISNNEYYYARWRSDDTITLHGPLAPDVDSTGETYVNGSTENYANVNITAVGSGDCTISVVRMLNSYATNDIYRAPGGSAIHADSSGYVGDSGWLQNAWAYSRTFTTPRDMSSEIISFSLLINQSQFIEYLCTIIDDDGDWVQWTIWNRLKEGNSTYGSNPKFVQIEVGSTYVQSLTRNSSGTFDASKVKHVVMTYSQPTSTSATARPGSVWDTYNFGLISPFTVYGGTSATPFSFFETAQKLQSLNSAVADTPSDLQIVLRQGISFGDGTNHFYLNASEKSVAFPPLADGVNNFSAYRESVGIFIDATDQSQCTIKNCQIGATAPFQFTVNAVANSVINLTGTTYVKGNIVLDSDHSYSGQLFVGGQGITHNNSEITSSKFIVTTDLGANNGMIIWGNSTDISDSEFELNSDVTDGHAIKINSPGTYTFDGLSFTNFGANGTSTAAVYNNSGGAVTINLSGDYTVPTIRNGISATTTVVASVTLTITGLVTGSEVRVYDSITNLPLDGIESSGTSFDFTYDASLAGSDVYIVIFHLNYKEIRLTDLELSTINSTIPVQQIVDRVYSNA